MSHFYGTLKGNRGEATRCGSKESGVRTVAASWNGAVTVKVYFDPEIGKDCFRVSQIPWEGAGCSETIATGILGEPIAGIKRIGEALVTTQDVKEVKR